MRTGSLHRGGRNSIATFEPKGRFAMVNRHIPTSLRLMPRALTRERPVKTCTEAFSNWRCRRRLSLMLGGSIVRDTVVKKVSHGHLSAKVTEVQWKQSGVG